MTRYLKTSETAVIENYPYGFKLKTQAKYSVEYRQGQGFRSIFQTLNPKTYRWNAPKKSTYHHLVVLRDEDGIITPIQFSFNGKDSLQRSIAFLSKNFDLFSAAEIKAIYGQLASMLKLDMFSSHKWCGADLKALLPLYDTAIKAAIKGYNTGENVMDEIRVDFTAVQALHIPDFNPFTIKELV